MSGLVRRDAYGRQVEGADALALGYVGGIVDSDTGLVRFGARDYDPVVGRWMAPDPIGFAGGSTNLYQYVSGDPLELTDPAGTTDSLRAACSAPLCERGAVADRLVI